MIATIDPIPAFSDNYLWLVHAGENAVVVDPGDGDAVLAAISARNLRLCAILITHHHPDHINGIGRLLAAFRVPVYGPRAEAGSIPQLSNLLDEGDRVLIPEVHLDLSVLAVPGHTLGHIAYYGEIAGRYETSGRSRRVLFCGDTLFVAGCGRLFEGTPQQMHASLAKLSALPEDTEVFCAHEYTLSNLAFAQAAEPGSPWLDQETTRVKDLRARNLPSVPSTIGRERRINPFLRCGVPALATSASARTGHAISDPVEIFAELRRWKDIFKAPTV